MFLYSRLRYFEFEYWGICASESKHYVTCREFKGVEESGGGALEWQEGVSGSSMDTKKHPNHVFSSMKIDP